MAEITKLLCALFGVALMGAAVHADVVETKNGSRLTGKIVSIDSTTVVLSTDFAGEIKIKQAEVISVATDDPMNFRLKDGTVVQGTVSVPPGTPEGDFVVNASAGAVDTPVAVIVESWDKDAKDPAVARLERHWSYEAGMDVTGKTGNAEQVGTSASFRATLKSSRDVLQLYAAYNRQVSDKKVSADQLRGGVDYQNNFSGRFSWYTRDEAGFDHVKDIDVYNVLGAGAGYDIVRTKVDTLTGRVGLSYRYESYGAPGAENLNSVGLDFGLNNQLTMKTWTMVNRITYTPIFEDFTNYRIYHESYIELPMASPRWKFRIGITNDYNSKPPAGVTEYLDTTYFARLILNWQ